MGAVILGQLPFLRGDFSLTNPLVLPVVDKNALVYY